jgi:hypothetical protein
MPFTKQRQWHKADLRLRLRDRYVWIEALGNRAYRTAGVIVIDDWPLGLSKIEKVLDKGPIILMCACEKVRDCHRLVVANQVHTVFGVPTRHLERTDIDRLLQKGEA